MEISSIAMSLLAPFPLTPSKTTCNTKKKLSTCLKLSYLPLKGLRGKFFNSEKNVSNHSQMNAKPIFNKKRTSVSKSKVRLMTNS